MIQLPGESKNNYSTDMIKKAAFVDELSLLRLIPPNDNTNEIKVIIEYMTTRIKQIDERHK